MRSVLLSRTDESYLQKCATEHKFAYGIIIGQHVDSDKDVVAHLAKNGEEEIELTTVLDEACPFGPQDIQDIDTQALANQWISARKMIPGSFEVFGMFVSSVKHDIVSDRTFAIAKKLLYDLYNLTTLGNNFSGLVDEYECGVLTFLVYSSVDRTIVGKSYSHSTNGGSFTDIESRFVEKPFEWYSFESSYEMDDIFPIIDAADKINIEDQFRTSILSVKKNLAISEVFIQNESLEDALKLESYVALRYGKKKKPDGTIRASIYLPLRCQMSALEPVRVKEFNGTIRFAGIISSRVWCNPQSTIGDVKRFLRNDILRSLVARTQVYCDGLTATNVSTEPVFISEPPRRVYFSLHAPACGSSFDLPAIQFSEYIFRGESATVAVAQAKQILDVDISSENIFADQEGLPDDEAFSESSLDVNYNGYPTGGLTGDLTRSMYMMGIAVSLLVLIVSILLHYLFW